MAKEIPWRPRRAGGKTETSIRAGERKGGRNAPEPVEGKAVSSTQGKETTRGADRKSGKKQPRGLMEKQKEKAIMR